MDIKMYEKRPKLVYAVKFEDDPILAEEIVQWVQRENGYAHHFGPGRFSTERVIDITDANGDCIILKVGYYLVCKGGGVFIFMTPAEFLAKYSNYSGGSW